MFPPGNILDRSITLCIKSARTGTIRDTNQSILRPLFSCTTVLCYPAPSCRCTCVMHIR